MDLMHNQVFWLKAGEKKGIYRVLAVNALSDSVASVRIADSPRSSEPAAPEADPSLQREAKVVFAKAPRHVRKPIYWGMHELQRYQDEGEFQIVEWLQEGRYYSTPHPDEESIADEKKAAKMARKKAAYDLRRLCMRPFLNLDLLNKALFEEGSFGTLVRQAMNGGVDPDQEVSLTGISKPLVYRLFAVLAFHGFAESSLLIRFDRCGAPGKLRPIGENGRKKAGRKTERERHEAADSNPDQGTAPPVQGGMSTAWREKVLWADSRIPSPKPKWPARYTRILDESFTLGFSEKNGIIVPQLPDIGAYPNIKQCQRVIHTELPKLVRLYQSTTKRHFAQTKRAIPGYSWEGVSGPGHTWVIDATVADMYARSSLNRAWIVGRPIAYIVVDVWSTAIVGFFLCLGGPSWDLAKIALFCSGANPHLVANLWGCEYIEVLNPHPTLPAVLLADRGEHLSKGAMLTGIALEYQRSFTAPWRPDLKGIGEVPHRIIKDEQYLFVPGSMDARRKEMELQSIDPRQSVFTIRDYASWLYWAFAYKYNMTANRSHRLDDRMRAAGVIPSPAGLWNWGHANGIGYRRHVPQDTLVSELLPKGTATITPKGVRFARATYLAPEEKKELWSATARNFGSTEVHAHYFPASPSSIWLPNQDGLGMHQLNLSEHSNISPGTTFWEVADSYSYELSQRGEREHAKNQVNAMAFANNQKRIEDAKRLTAEADAQAGYVPPVKDARALEVAAQHQTPALPEEPPPSAAPNMAELNFLDSLDAALNAGEQTNQLGA